MGPAAGFLKRKKGLFGKSGKNIDRERPLKSLSENPEALNPHIVSIAARVILEGTTPRDSRPGFFPKHFHYFQFPA